MKEKRGAIEPVLCDTGCPCPWGARAHLGSVSSSVPCRRRTVHAWMRTVVLKWSCISSSWWNPSLVPSKMLLLWVVPAEPVGSRETHHLLTKELYAQNSRAWMAGLSWPTCGHRAKSYGILSSNQLFTEAKVHGLSHSITESPERHCPHVATQTTQAGRNLKNIGPNLVIAQIRRWRLGEEAGFFNSTQLFRGRSKTRKQSSAPSSFSSGLTLKWTKGLALQALLCGSFESKRRLCEPCLTSFSLTQILKASLLAPSKRGC